MITKFSIIADKFKSFKLHLSLKIQQIMLLFQHLYKKRNLYKIIFCLCIIIATIGYGYIEFKNHQKLSIQNAVKFNQALMINIETNEIFSGSFYKDKITVPIQYVPPTPLSDIFEPKKLEVVDLRKNPLSDTERKKAKIVLVITNLGLSKYNTITALDLPPYYTLGFSPYANEIENWVNQATNKGFEVLMNLPMQPSDYPINDPGPFALLNNLSTGENLTRLDWILKRSDKIIGVYTSENETFFNTNSNISNVLNELNKHELIFSYGNISNRDNVEPTAKLAGAHLAPADIMVDNELSQAKILNNLKELEKIALKNGSAIGFMNAYPITLDIAKSWIKELDKDKTIIVNISNLFEDPRNFYSITKDINDQDLIGPIQEKDLQIADSDDLSKKLPKIDVPSTPNMKEKDDKSTH